MARRRRRKNKRPNDQQVSDLERFDQELEQALADKGEDVSELQRSEPEDKACLTHPGRDVDRHCDDCDTPMCTMCSVLVGSEEVCAECFTTRVHAWARGDKWRGPLAMVLGLVGIAAVVAPYTLATESMTASLPGGAQFFKYLALGTAVAAVALGFAAQDFRGFNRRTGAVGAGMAILVLGAATVLDLLGVITA